MRAALGVFAEKGPEGAVIEDFIRAAGIARGTFYNHFDNVEDLLERTSIWLIDELIENTVEPLISLHRDPAARFSLGIRLFLHKAETDPQWSQFIARIWNLGLLEQPRKDIRSGIRKKLFHVPSVEAAFDVLLGTYRETLTRLATGRLPRHHIDNIAVISLQALGVDQDHIAEVMQLPLPDFEPIATRPDR